VYAEQVSKHLAQRGHESVVITTKPCSNISALKPSLEYLDGVKIYRFYPLNLYFLPRPSNSTPVKGIWSLIDTWNPHPYHVVKQILAKERPDVVHLHTPVSLSLSMFSAVKALKLPLIFTLHDYHLLCKRTFLLHANGKLCTNPIPICKLYRKISRGIVDSKPNLVISPSQFALDMLVNEGFFQNSAKVVIPNGVKIPKQPTTKVRNKYMDILYLGSVSRHKGVHFLVQAFRQLKDQKLRLHIAGRGPNLEELKDIAEGDQRIRFYGFVSDESKEELFSMADVFVLPTIWYENSPNVIRESFANGTPVIASRMGGVPELVGNGHNGFLFEAGDVGKLKDILQELSKNPSELEKLSNGASESAKKYDMEGHLNRLEKLYQQIAS